MKEPELKFGTLGEMIDEQGTALGEETFLVDAGTGDEWSYAEVKRASSEVAKSLTEAGIQPGDKVSTILSNSPPVVIAICGILKAGAVAVPINAEYTSREMGYILKNSESNLAITEAELADRVTEAAEKSGVKTILSVEPSSSNFYRTSTDETFGENSTPTDTAVLMFTSGTTGDPKGVALSHNNILTRFAGGSLTVGGEYTFYTILPLYNIDGFSTTFATLYRGQTNVLKDGFSASEFWDDVENFGTSMTSVVPSILAILIKNGPPRNKNTSSFETIFVSGSYVHDKLINDFEDMFSIDVMEIYGLTEASGTSFASAEERVISSCGYANRYSELSIHDEETGETLPPEELGEVVIRGPTVFKEYYNNKEATREVLQGGWFHTGDIGYQDEEGRYYILDREKNIIIKGGQNIHPGEIEEIIHAVPQVEDVAIVGEEDEIYGEIIKAFVLSHHESDNEKFTEELKSIAAENLTGYKVPDEFVFVDSFSRGETGKILKEELG